MAEPAAVLLAAGGSRRLGQAKQLVALDGVPLVRRQASLLLRHFNDVLVVTGAQGEAVSEALEGLDVRVQNNDDWASGMASSLAVGISALGDHCPAALVLLCDQFRVTDEDLVALLETQKRHPEAIVAARWGDGAGAPALFPATFFSRLLGLRGDTGARAVIRSAGDAVRFVDMENAAHDVDTPADLAALSGNHSGG